MFFISCTKLSKQYSFFLKSEPESSSKKCIQNDFFPNKGNGLDLIINFEKTTDENLDTGMSVVGNGEFLGNSSKRGFIFYLFT